ncbi:MAG: anthranilate phosphoribosyltransferase [Deltaproteobacteria bacterium]|nr:anthranilate phosphoribosyltransferase [Deltaproteobacteria bacterium]
MIKEAIAQVVAGENLGEKEMEGVMEEIMTGQATAAQIGAFLTALHLKGETVEEITGAARMLRAKALRIRVNKREILLDTCGTGGGLSTFNVSTATAFVAAGAGVRVAKHGNRAVSSRAGSADVLESLGFNLHLSTGEVERSIREIGIGFLFAPLFHGAMEQVASSRREIGIHTIFNLLGPLTNPAGASAQVLGVYDPALTEKLARVLERLGTREAFVVCGEGPYDEISICGPTHIAHLKDKRVRTFDFSPEEVGFQRARPESIQGGDAAENARIIRAILDGEPGPRREMVLLNAAAAFMIVGLDRTFPEGAKRGAATIDSGRAREKLEQLIAFSQQWNKSHA